MSKHKTYFNWSSGKDSALALYNLLKEDNYSIEQLVTTINSHYNRVSMHGLRRELLEAQTKALGIESTTIELPEQPTMDNYNRILQEKTNDLRSNGFTHAAFGDVFLEDIRNYRDKELQKQNLISVYPLWKKNTKTLLNEFLDLGFKTVIVCAKTEHFTEDFVGSIIDKDFVNKLPEGVDPCGENGEFHTFCYDGPIFKNPIAFDIGEKIYREYNTPKTEKSSCVNNKTGFWYCDLVPEN